MLYFVMICASLYLHDFVSEDFQWQFYCQNFALFPKVNLCSASYILIYFIQIEFVSFNPVENLEVLYTL